MEDEAIKFVKKDCGVHSGPTSGPCSKCNATPSIRPSSFANSLEGIVGLSNGVRIEFTSKDSI